MKLELDIAPIDACPCVSARGDLDFQSCRELQRVLGDLIAEGHGTIRLDLSQVNYLDSEGVAVLLWGLAQQRRLGRRLLLWRISERGHKVLRILGLANLWESPESEAVAS